MVHLARHGLAPLDELIGERGQSCFRRGDLNTIVILHTPIPQPIPLIGAVVIQVLFVLGEGLYL